MMTLAILLAVLLLAFSAFAAFGLPWLVMGPRAFEEFGERADMQAMSVVAGVAMVAVLALPFAATGLISAPPQLQVFAETILGAASRDWS